MEWKIEPNKTSLSELIISDQVCFPIVSCCSNSCFLNLPTCDSNCPRNGAYHCGKGNMC